MAPKFGHLLDEADIGSGEKTPGQLDLENEQRTVGEAPPNERVLRSGDHLARMMAVRQPDDTFEAQVYVRLTREPARAETYIPAGMFATEAEAWAAAEARARRAFEERQF